MQKVLQYFNCIPASGVHAPNVGRGVLSMYIVTQTLHGATGCYSFPAAIFLAIFPQGPILGSHSDEISSRFLLLQIRQTGS